MTLLSVIRAELAYGMTPLLDQASLTLTEGERIGFIGRNGSGKSSLLGAICGRVVLDGGEIRPRDGLHIVQVEQEPELPPADTLRDSLLKRAGPLSEHDLDQGLSLLNAFLDRFGLDPDMDPSGCSGGEKKRAALALAFALQPELLLLDEPTNHLDLAAIERLEDLLLVEQRGQRAALIITHDRHFLDRVATRILELDRGQLRSYPGNFAAYEARKAEQLEAENLERRRFDKFWAQEEVWIRKGIEARRTRNEGRVRRLEQLRHDRAERRERMGAVRLNLDAGEKSGRMVAELDQVSVGFNGRTLVQDLDLRLMRGDRLALVGPNGAGKSTLIKILLGALKPHAGSVRVGTRLEVAYFDQHRAVLDPERTVVQTISPGSDWIEVGGVRKHVMSYLGDFLFSPRRAEAPVRTLSGGERNRLLLARLFAQPANVLVLDEPTNDLDMETLELLESTLTEYAGTLLLVSHDRRFLDALATQCLVSQGDGRWLEYAGGYSDWLQQKQTEEALRKAAGRDAAPRVAERADTDIPRGANRNRSNSTKLSFKEQRELDGLPALMETLEAERSALLERMSQADYHRLGAEQLKADSARSGAIDAELEAALERWVVLEARRNGEA
jgi:ATP-binding cassette subfamily F protein uup